MSKRWQRLLLVSLLGTLTGCQSMGAPAHADAPRAGRESAAMARSESVVHELSATHELAAFAGAPVETPAPAAAAPLSTCAATPDKHGYFGFYSSDPWEKGDVVLTFDDGPHPTATPRVLDLLAKNDMKATFFVIGRAINRDTYPLLQRMVAEGHTIGSHTYSHDVKMTKVEAPARSVEDIRGQHEVTAILIDLSMMAKSGDDFDAMYRKVFESDPAHWLEGHTIRTDYAKFLTNHKALLEDRGYANGTRPYAVLYSRPPGGGPYVEHDGARGMAIYDEALSKLGMMNVLWHGASGDTDPAHKRELGFLTGNIDHYSASGGVLLIHDYIRSDALTESITKIAENDKIHVISMGESVRRKYGCNSDSLSVQLADTAAADILGRGAIAGHTSPVALPTGPVAALLGAR